MIPNNIVFQKEEQKLDLTLHFCKEKKYCDNIFLCFIISTYMYAPTQRNAQVQPCNIIFHKNYISLMSKT